MLKHRLKPIATGGSNVTLPEPEYREIPLNKGLATKVSHHQFEKYGKLHWWSLWDTKNNSFRAVRKAKSDDGRWALVYLHREILGLKRGDKRKGDHENHDTLDNRDSNLRIATDRQNAMNRRNRIDNRSGQKGVSFYARYGKWRARIMVDGKSKLLGYFDTFELACAARIKATIEMHGEFSCIG